MDGIDSMGYEKTTPVQELAIPAILEGKDLIASAQTGTGKTAAFLLPVIHKILHSKKEEHISALIIVPTRELAVQIGQQMAGLSYFTDVSSIEVYGGQDGISFSQEKQALTEGADLIICTPGRMMAHLKMEYVKISELEYLILDEADRMLDMGFHDDIMLILSYLPKKRQNLLFSATMPPKIRQLAKKVLSNPLEINISLSTPPDKILQVAFVVYEAQKLPLAKFLLASKDINSVLIFCSTKINTKQLGTTLKRAGLSAEDIHSDLDQKTRENVLMKFKNRKLNILVATDIMSRGIDVENIDLVINYDVPNDGEDYIHRIGRTARAETKGLAFTFINEEEQYKFLEIEQLLGKPVSKAKIPKELGPSPEYNPKKSRRAGNFRGRRPLRKRG